MTEWRLLVDEDSEDATEPLRTRGFDVKSGPETTGKGTQDPDVGELARETGRTTIVTADSDFLKPELNRGLTVLMVPNGEMPGAEVARRVEKLIEWAITPDRLGRVHYLEE